MAGQVRAPSYPQGYLQSDAEVCGPLGGPWARWSHSGAPGEGHLQSVHTDSRPLGDCGLARQVVVPCRLQQPLPNTWFNQVKKHKQYIQVLLHMRAKPVHGDCMVIL